MVDMADIEFTDFGVSFFNSKGHGKVSLSKTKWDKICGQPERWFYRLNSEKVGLTLVNPDNIRHHRTNENQFIYYKKFNSLKMSENTSAVTEHGTFFAVVIDISTKRVCTVYPVQRPKDGKEFKGALK